MDMCVWNLQINADSVDAFFDLQVGAVTDTNNGSGTASAVSSSIQAAVNGFYKCTLQFFDTAVGPSFFVLALSNAADNSGSLLFGSPNYTGDGSSGIWMWRPKWGNT
jgi:hypothetical protein